HSPGSNPPEVFHEASEQPESENLTHDPSVDPETLEVLPRRRRRRRRGAGNAQPSNGEVAVVDTASPSRRPMTVPPMAQQQDVSNEPTNEILTALRQLLDERKKRSTGSDASWNSRQGPEKHVKWRGGAAPSPPAWKPQANDLRAFARWERRIEIWRLQVVAYMPPQDAALMLLTSLTGEAELEVEHLDLQKVHHRNGIQYILDTLREPLQQKQLFQKRTLLDSFEKLSRFPNESLRQYINRYRRVEKDLEAIGISSSNMYDSESKGNRLLERARLAPDLQRLVMIAAGNSLEYERIQEALNLQFPDFKPAPAVFQRERDNASRPPPSGKGSAFSSSSSTAASTWSSASSRPSSKGFGKHHPKRAFVAEQADDLGDIPEQPEDEEPVDDDGFYEAEEEPAEATVDNDNTEDAPESEIQDAVAQLADVLTVTSKKLQSTVLGRKFTGRPRTIDDRKRTSTCSACGRVGHWHGDAICPQSGSSSQGHDNKGRGKSNSDGKGKGQQHRGSSSTSQPTKQAFMVRFPDSDEPEKDFDHHTSYFSYTTFFLGNQPTTTFVTEVIDFSGTMILDTACQRACCGNYWLSLHSKILSHHRLTVKNVETTDLFQFGSGGPKRSTCRAYLPASLPEWMQAWRSLVMKVMMLEFRALRAMARLVKFGLRPRRWMTAWELEELKKDHAKDMALQTKTTPPQPMSTCTHPEFRRYGNKHGSYAQCKRCMAKFQWNPDEEGWLQLGGDSSLRFTPLPLPSSDNIICPVTGLDAIQYKQGALAKSTPKAKAKSKKSATSSSASNTSRTTKGSGKGKSSVPTIHLPLQDDQAVWTPEEWEAHWEQIRADYHPNDVIMPDSDDPDQYPDDQDTPRYAAHLFR
ncbi:Integrase catalytic domain-containing protein, partial [Durusdinium trenchii]